MTTPWHDGRVLLVQRTVDGLAAMLAGEGLQVERACDADSALRAVSDRAFEAIVVDQEVAGHSGADLASELLGVSESALVLVAPCPAEGAVRALNKTGSAVVLIRPLAEGELEAWVRYAVVARRMRSKTLVA